jgi:hypothetical protein
VLTKLESFSPGINFVDSPVKVAILDTGVQIPNHRLTNNFEQRLKECRTWLGTSASEGEKLAPGGHDADGHGTHGTSVLLQATRNTGIHVYAAQVFKDGDELVPQTASNNDNIVTRIVNVRILLLDLSSPLTIRRPSSTPSKHGKLMLFPCPSDSHIWFLRSMTSWNTQGEKELY